MIELRGHPLGIPTPRSVKWTMGLCAGALALQYVDRFLPGLGLDMIGRFALIPARVLPPHPQAWRLVTYLFLHGGFWHVSFNLFSFWMFGVPLAAQWGDAFFARYALLCGIGAGLAQVALMGRSPIPTIGLSGSVYGVMTAFAMMYPDAVVELYFFVPMRAATMVAVFAVLEFVAGFTDVTPGIARFAHLGGMLTGWLYLRAWWPLKARVRARLTGGA